MKESQKLQKQKVVLAFSGGLDTCYCLWTLVNKAYEVHTVFVSTGGISQAEVRSIAERAHALGATKHHVLNAEDDLWDQFVKPLLWSDARVLNAYPLLCSDRYLIVQYCLELCKQLNTKLFAHGCTGMGNDQMRFDQTVASLGDYQVIAPIRDLQNTVTNVRDYEIEQLSTTGVELNTASKQYSINENLLGVTISGSEIDQFQAPDESVYQWCKPRSEWPSGKLSIQLEFVKGVPVKLNGEEISGPSLLKTLNKRFGEYGVGKHLYTGDVILGLKGRIAFECPGVDVLQVAHKALADTVNTKMQNQFHQQIANRWTELVYSGYFYEPHKKDLEAYLQSSQSHVTGTVTIETDGGSLLASSVQSNNLLVNRAAVYAQHCDWSSEEAIGFIKLSGMSTSLARKVRCK